MLEDAEKNLEEFKKAIESRDKQLSDIKKILQGARKSYDSAIKENTELKQYIENIKQRYQQYQKQQQQEYFDREREYFRQKQPKNNKKVVYEEESDNEPEVHESIYILGLLDLEFQGMLEDINTREKTAHPSYTDMEQLDFQVQLTDNYYLNPNNVYVCFPIKI